MSTNLQHLEEWAATLPISANTIALAEGYANQHPNPLRSERIRQNTLAVCAVRDYLHMLGISTDLDASESKHLLNRLCDDVADLMVKGVGRLECRPVLPGDSSCFIPMSLWDDRKAFLAVQLDQSASQATILGFTLSPAAEDVPLAEFRPLDDLFDILGDTQSTQPGDLPPLSQSIRISDWLAQVSRNAFTSTAQSFPDPLDLLDDWTRLQGFLGFEPSWAMARSIAEDLSPQTRKQVADAKADPDNREKRRLAVEQLTHDILDPEVPSSQRWASVKELASLDPQNPVIGASRITSVELDERMLNLRVQVVRRQDGVDCWYLRVESADSVPQLPEDAVLSILDEAGNIINSISADPLEGAFEYDDLEVKPDTLLRLRLSRGEIWQEFEFIS